MKFPQHKYEQLKAAIDATGGMPANATERQRWDALWRAVDARLFDLTEVYKLGDLSDEHIDTALRRIAQHKSFVTP